MVHQKHHEATHCCWRECKKILQGTCTNISPAKMSQQSLGKAMKHITKALLRRKMLRVHWQNLLE